MKRVSLFLVVLMSLLSACGDDGVGPSGDCGSNVTLDGKTYNTEFANIVDFGVEDDLRNFAFGFSNANFLDSEFYYIENAPQTIISIIFDVYVNKSITLENITELNLSYNGNSFPSEDDLYNGYLYFATDLTEDDTLDIDDYGTFEIPDSEDGDFSAITLKLSKDGNDITAEYSITFATENRKIEGCYSGSFIEIPN